MDVSLSELRELVMDREAWRAVIHGVTKSLTRLSDWSDLILLILAVNYYQEEKQVKTDKTSNLTNGVGRFFFFNLKESISTVLNTPTMHHYIETYNIK